jgi:AcrR family transcriptional regulator
MGFEGASTRSIARRVDAHQPQINYHFESKEALWAAAVNHLFTLLRDALGEMPTLEKAGDTETLGRQFAVGLGRFVRFVATHPELNRILVHEATCPTDRLRWLVDRHVRPLYLSIAQTWQHLRDAGIAAPIEASVVHYVIVGATSLPFVNAPEARLLTGTEPTDPEWVTAHAAGIVATLLPGLGG